MIINPQNYEVGEPFLLLFSGRLTNDTYIFASRQNKTWNDTILILNFKSPQQAQITYFMEIHVLVAGMITKRLLTDVPFHISITKELDNHIKLVAACITDVPFKW